MSGPFDGFNFKLPQDDMLLQASNLQAQLEEQREEMYRDLEEATRERNAALEQKVQREIKALELSEALLEQQRTMVSEQRELRIQQESQAIVSGTDRKIQYAILTATLMALAVAVAAIVYTVFESLVWTVVVFAGSGAAGGLGAWSVIRGGLRKERSASPSRDV